MMAEKARMRIRNTAFVTRLYSGGRKRCGNNTVRHAHTAPNTIAVKKSENLDSRGRIGIQYTVHVYIKAQYNVQLDT